MYSSGVTMPDTTASPRPQLALIINWSVAVLIGLPVNITPATSDSTIIWMTTAMEELKWSKPWVLRYDTARDDHIDAQQRLTASIKLSVPRISR
ncbi:hypothetical protein D9M68_989710 [compost metagenome]